MSEAHRFARVLNERPWPNPPVGAVVVRDGEIVGRGAHFGPGTAHAEIVALSEAGDLARGATLYVTLEPCNHQGRTAPCAPAVVTSGVSRVVIGVSDPNPLVAGGGVALLRDAGITVDIGILARGCLELIWPFVVTEAFQRPFVILKTAQSLDGCFAPPADPDGRPFYLTCDESLDEVHRIRRWCDLVLVGAGTVRSDSPRLDGRRADGSAWSPKADPRVGCVDADLSSAVAWRDDPITVFTTTEPDADRESILVERGSRVLHCDESDGRIDPHSIVEQAHTEGIQAILVEGGPRLAASFLAANMVDRWVQFVAPVVLGDGLRWPEGWHPGLDSSRWHLTRSTRSDRDSIMVWDRTEFLSVRQTLTGLTTGED